ncbi:MAG TPA: hypothetical protein VFT75_01310 [Nocardioidaceae bacterium]|jgi:hypothetical protein|nr:hypothetical protein [Nocardioidaceae bacterium]
MAEEDLDPAANTQMFQAFVDRRELDEELARTRHRSGWGWAALAAAAVLAIAALIAWLVLFR